MNTTNNAISDTEAERLAEHAAKVIETAVLESLADEYEQAKEGPDRSRTVIL